MPPAIESPLSKECPLTDDEQRVVVENERLVLAIASRNFRGSKLPVEDRVQAGMSGLMKAVRKYDADRDIAFSTYATYWIKNAIRQAEMKDDPVHVPLWVRHNHADAVVQARAERFHHARDQAFQVSGGVCDDDLAGESSSESPVDDADEAAWLRSKIDLLTAKQQDVLLSIYWDGEDGDTISRRYDVSRNCIWLWKERALSHLRAIYEEEYAKGA